MNTLKKCLAKTEVSVNLDSNNNGTYNAYIDDSSCSGTQYYNKTARQIGDLVAGLIDTLEEAATGNCYLKTRQEVIFVSDGTLKRDIYDSYEEAYAAMKSEYEAYAPQITDRWISEKKAVIRRNGSDCFWTILSLPD